MAFVHLYPYTDFHELNLDWLIKQIEEIKGASGITYDDTNTNIGATNVQEAIEKIKELLDTYAQQASNFVLVENAIPEAYWNAGHAYTHLQTVNDATLTAIINATRENKYVVLARTVTGVTNYTDFYILTDIAEVPADYKHTLTFKNVLSNKNCSLIINGLNDDANVYVELNADTQTTLVNAFNSRTGNVSPQAGDYNANDIDYDPTYSQLVATNTQDAIDEIKTITDGKQDTLSFDASPTLGSSDPVTSNGIKTALDAKQDTLSFDPTPTLGSNNPVTSDGIAQAIQSSVTGVVEWNGRSGYVLPQASDYDASQIDFDPSTTSLSPNATTVQKAIEELSPAQITVTLTINGAKEDNITIFDSNSTQVGSCVFASGQTSGTCQIIVPLGGGSYTFTSSVTNYSKTVTLTDNLTQTVNAFPDHSIYWRGNKVVAISTYWNGSGSPTTVLTENTQHINLYVTVGGKIGFFTDSTIDLSNYSKIRVTYKNNQDTEGVVVQWGTFTASTANPTGYVDDLTASTITTRDVDISSVSTTEQVAVTSRTASEGQIFDIDIYDVVLVE